MLRETDEGYNFVYAKSQDTQYHARPVHLLAVNSVLREVFAVEEGS